MFQTSPKCWQSQRASSKSQNHQRKHRFQSSLLGFHMLSIWNQSTFPKHWLQHLQGSDNCLKRYIYLSVAQMNGNKRGKKKRMEENSETLIEQNSRTWRRTKHEINCFRAFFPVAICCAHHPASWTPHVGPWQEINVCGARGWNYR